MPPPKPELPETRDRRCPACQSEAVTSANHVLAVHGAIKEQFRCTACGTAFWGRQAYMTPELRRVVAAQIDRVRGLERGLGGIIPHLFPHLEGRFKGQRRRHYRQAWKTACTETGGAGGFGTTSGGRRSGTSSTRVSPSAWP